MTIHPDVVGIDVSKHHLDVFDAARGRGERLTNTAEAIAALVQRLAGPDRLTVFEATGDYDLLLRRALEAAGSPYVRVNPTRARDFARAAGFLAKTDAVDARMLAALGTALRPAPATPSHPARQRLAQLHKRRDQLVAMRKQERTRRAEASDPDLIDDLDDHLAWLDRTVARFDKDIAAFVAEQPALDQASRLIRSIPGVGPVTAATLLALVPELGLRSPKALAALAGLAPFNHDSGKLRGTRAIRGGRKRVRDALYMAAVAACRSQSRFKTSYKALRDAGKPPKLAFIAIARKLLITANAVIRDQQPFHA
ncbi:transposase, partial [Caulobacter sp. AP07]|uniref:IS110 family transposase n=1 Tax=Caulobacter sp. AP07 TaxID=1144304 RepID=UPI000271E479